MQTFKEYLNEGHQGADTSWTDNINGQEVTISMTDVNNYLDQAQVPIVPLNPEELRHLLIDTERDPARVQAASLEFPIILVRNEQGQYSKILDGQHRLVKVFTNNIEQINTRTLDLATAPEEYKGMFY